MRKALLIPITIFTFVLSTSSNIYADEFIRIMTNGQCETYECFSIYNTRAVSGGECETSDCLGKWATRAVTGGECETSDCLDKWATRAVTGGECETRDCLLKSLGFPEGYVGSGGYDYDVSGYGVTGEIDSDGRDVDGYLTLDDGTEVSFEGEWSGKGEIEGYDENGNYYELEVD